MRVSTLRWTLSVGMGIIVGGAAAMIFLSGWWTILALLVVLIAVVAFAVWNSNTHALPELNRRLGNGQNSEQRTWREWLPMVTSVFIMLPVMVFRDVFDPDPMPWALVVWAIIGVLMGYMINVEYANPAGDRLLSQIRAMGGSKPDQGDVEEAKKHRRVISALLEIKAVESIRVRFRSMTATAGVGAEELYASARELEDRGMVEISSIDAGSEHARALVSLTAAGVYAADAAGIAPAAR